MTDTNDRSLPLGNGLRAMFAALATLFLVAPAAQAQNAAAADERPNVIIILADDLGFGQLGSYGSTTINTPNLDRLAASGIRFTQAYAGGTTCSPSRVSLYTGRDSRLLHGNTNGIKLRAQDRTVAHLMKAAGYETAIFGKYGVGTIYGENDPLTMGFDHYYGTLDNISSHRQYPTHVFNNNEFDLVSPNIGGAKNAYAQELFTNRALRFLREPQDKPFFMVLSYTTPHAELAAPEEFVAPYRGRFPETPYAGLTGDGPYDRWARFYPEPVDQPNAVLAGMVTALDHYVGQVMSALEQQGLAENTVVIFTSDNGPHAEGGVVPEEVAAAGPYKGHKRDLFDGGIHVPMIVSWPAQIRAGRVDDTPWYFADVLPTMAAIGGISPLAVDGIQTNGVSILPILKSENAYLDQRILYWEFALERPLTGIAQAGRMGKWKAVRYGEDKPMGLYDIVADPGEATDLSAQNPAIAERFLTLFASELAN